MLAACGLTLGQDTPPKTEAAEGTFDLRPVLKKGSTSRYRLTQITEQKMELMGEKRHTVSTTIYDASQTCLEAFEDGGGKILLKYERVELKNVENKKKTLDYDSSKDKLDDLEEGDRMKAVLAGLEFTVTVDVEGKVEKLEGYDKFKQAVREHVSEMHADMVEAIAGEAMMRDAIEQTTRNLPKEKVNKGDKWNAEWGVKAPLLGEVTYKIENTLAGPATRNARKCLKVTQTGTIEVGGESMFEFKDVDWKGTLWIDIATRETVYSESKMKSEMIMNLGGEVKVPSEVITRVELLPAKDADKGGKPAKGGSSKGAQKE